MADSNRDPWMKISGNFFLPNYFNSLPWLSSLEANERKELSRKVIIMILELQELLAQRMVVKSFQVRCFEANSYPEGKLFWDSNEIPIWCRPINCYTARASRKNDSD